VRRLSVLWMRSVMDEGLKCLRFEPAGRHLGAQRARGTTDVARIGLATIESV